MDSLGRAVMPMSKGMKLLRPLLCKEGGNTMTAFVIVTCMIMADIITGLCYAFFTKTFKSSIMRQGAMHKLGEIMAMAVMYGLEYALPVMGLGVDIPFVNIAATYIIIMEIGSVFENIGHMNPDIGELMDTVLSKIKGDHHE